jgi:hypothetical protein
LQCSLMHVLIIWIVIRESVVHQSAWSITSCYNTKFTA